MKFQVARVFGHIGSAPPGLLVGSSTPRGDAKDTARREDPQAIKAKGYGVRSGPAEAGPFKNRL